MSWLFQRGWIGKMELRNRIIMAAMTLGYTRDGFINEKIKNFYVERAKGGVGLIIVGGCYVDRLRVFGPDFIGIDSDEFIPKLKELTSAVHQYGAKIAAQLHHGGRFAPSKLMGVQPVSVSNIPSRLTKEIPQALTTPEIHQTIEKYSQAARRGKDAGFDAVEISGGYLIGDFLSAFTNNRTDQYGGDIKGRMRFLLGIIESVRGKVGKDFPIIVRFSANQLVKGGNTPREARVIAKALEIAGVDALNVRVMGTHDSKVPEIVMSVPRGAWVYFAQRIKEVVNIPIITSHRINEPLLAEKILEDGKADFIYMGRPLLADPELPNKAAEGRLEDIRTCIACNQGCLDSIFRAQPVTCLVNAQTGREKELEIKPAAKVKKIMIVGGGPAGMEAARVSALRGHGVTLYEKDDRLGGQVNLAAIPPGREEFRNVVRYLSKQLEKLGVKVNLGEKVTSATVERERPDAVVVAAGAIPIIPDVPGIDGENVATANDVLLSKADIGKKVVVVGGGAVGCETALFLAKKGAIDAQTALFFATHGVFSYRQAVSLTRKDRDITVVEMLEKAGRDIGPTTRWTILESLRQHKVKIITGVKLEEITDKGMFIKKDEQRQFLRADTVVIAVGSRANTQPYEELKGKVAELYMIGDCKEPRKALEAIHEGFAVGNQI